MVSEKKGDGGWKTIFRTLTEIKTNFMRRHIGSKNNPINI